MRLAAVIPALMAALLTTPVRAQTEPSFATGTFVMIVRDYDSVADKMLDTPPEGEGEACFRVMSLTKWEVEMQHVSGFYHPWWSDTPFEPGGIDRWSNSDAWRENRPGSAPLSEIRAIMVEVPACPKEPSS